MHFDYGFDYSKIVNVQLQGAPYQQVANVFAQVPGVETVAGTDIIPATGTNNGVPLKKQGTTDETENASIILADENFTKTLGISLVAGQPLPADSRSLVLVNETAVRKLGYDNPAQIIGQIVEPTTNEKPMRVVGVVKDFQYLLLVNGREIGPLVIKNQPKDFQYVTVKVGGTPMQTIKDLEQKWKEIDPIHPFKYRFYEDQLAATHQGVLDLVMVLGFIAFLAIVIASLGLLGMTTYSIERKTKEVGIRKVLGASTSNIALLLSREFVIILILAVALGAPLSLFVNNLWLLKLATRVDFGWGTVLMGTSLLLLIGLSIIVSQTLRLSNTNPVQSLKSE
jgi:putative ABC transport system permease protein